MQNMVTQVFLLKNEKHSSFFDKDYCSSKFYFFAYWTTFYIQFWCSKVKFDLLYLESSRVIPHKRTKTTVGFALSYFLKMIDWTQNFTQRNFFFFNKKLGFPFQTFQQLWLGLSMLDPTREHDTNPTQVFLG